MPALKAYRGGWLVHYQQRGLLVRKKIYVEGVIFDLDGTLIDSTVQHYQATMAVVEKLGGTECSFARYLSLLQHHTHFTMYQNLGVQADEKSIVRAFMAVWLKFSRSITPMPGVYDMLKNLWEKGVVLGLVSGSQQHILRASLQNFNLSHFFDAAYMHGSSEKSLVRKEVAFAELMHTWRIPALRIATVGDMPFEMHAAKKHGMHAIGFLGGLGTQTTLKEAGADYCIRKLSTLADVIHRERNV